MNTRHTDVAIGMAVLPERLENLRRIVSILLPQCDRLHIHLNGASHVPDFLSHERIAVTVSGENRGDLMKFTGAASTNGYFLTVDDDILYPPDYVATLIETLKNAGDRALVSVCGSLFNPAIPGPGVFHRTGLVHFIDGLAAPRRLMIPGTGTLCMNTSTFTMTPGECPVPNMADIWVACKAARLEIPIFAAPRPDNWLTRLPEHGRAIRMNNPDVAIEAELEANKPQFTKIYREITLLANGQETSLTPLVSVIIPTFNRPQGLHYALASIATQNYPCVETIVVNDGGCDISEVIAKFPAPDRLFCVSHSKNRGTGAARNTGLLAARGEFIAYLDDDSYFFPSHLSTLATLLQVDPAAPAAYTTRVQTAAAMHQGALKTVQEPVIMEQGFDLQNLLTAYYFPLTSIMHRRSALDQSGTFRETLDVLENWDFLIRLGIFAGEFAFLSRATSGTTIRTDLPRRGELSLYHVSSYRAICNRYAEWTTAATRRAQEERLGKYTGLLQQSRRRAMAHQEAGA